MLRIAAASRTRRRAAALTAVALSEAGATTGEVAQTRWRDLDLTTGRVRLPGAGTTMARTVDLTAWGHRTLAKDTPERPDDPVVYRGTADPTSDTAQAAITSRLRRLLHVAGLDDPDLRPGSIRLCLPAQRLANGGRIEHQAAVLGLTSLDITAEQLCWNWRA